MEKNNRTKRKEKCRIMNGEREGERNQTDRKSHREW